MRPKLFTLMLLMLLPALASAEKFSVDRQPGRLFESYGIRELLAHADQLELTDQQRQKLEEISVSYQMQRVDKFAEYKKAQIRLRQLVRNNKDASRNEVLAQMDRVTTLRGELIKARYLHREEVRAVLTPAQLNQIKEIRRQYLEQRRERVQKRVFERRFEGI